MFLPTNILNLDPIFPIRFDVIHFNSPRCIDPKYGRICSRIGTIIPSGPSCLCTTKLHIKNILHSLLRVHFYDFYAFHKQELLFLQRQEIDSYNRDVACFLGGMN